MRLKSFKLEIKKQKYLFARMFSKVIGFTLIETLISVCIIAIAATAVIYVLNPSETFIQNEDLTRVNDLKVLDKAIKFNKISGSFLNYDEFKNKVFISLPDTNDNDYCDEYVLPSLESGWDYRCMAPSGDLIKIDGNGWIPIDFSGSVNQPINKLPIDPINSPTRNNYYTFNLGITKNSYSLSAKLESEKYVIEIASLDGGNNNIVYEIRPISWTTVPTVTTGDSVGLVGSFTSIAIDSSGKPVVAYISNSGKDLRVLKCGNAYCTAGNVVSLVDTAGNIGQDTAIAIAGDGFPVISYRHETSNKLKVAKCNDDFCSPGNVVINVVDPSSNVGKYSSIAKSSDGFPIISYYDESNRDLKVVKCGNAVCSAGNIISLVDTTGDVGKYTSIAIGTDNLPVISYYDNSDNNLKVVKCGNVFCSTVGGYAITPIDTLGKVGEYTSIAVSNSNLPIISYYDESNRNLKVAKCGNASCSVAGGYDITPIDTLGTVGEYTSITIGTDQKPIISYYDNSNDNLKVVKCGNAACSAGNSVNTADSAGRVGQYTSITVSPIDNLPVVSYYNASSKDLKIAKCNQSNNFCSNGE